MKNKRVVKRNGCHANSVHWEAAFLGRTGGQGVLARLRQFTVEIALIPQCQVQGPPSLSVESCALLVSTQVQIPCPAKIIEAYNILATPPFPSTSKTVKAHPIPPRCLFLTSPRTSCGPLSVRLRPAPPHPRVKLSSFDDAASSSRRRKSC